MFGTIIEHGRYVIEISKEVKTEILVNSNEASSTIEPLQDWEGMIPEQILSQLASTFDINLQQLQKK